MRHSLGKVVGVGIRRRVLRCGCTLETWRHSQHRSPPCEFHAKADADLGAHEWLHQPMMLRLSKTFVFTLALFGPMVAPICAFTWLLTESVAMALVPLVFTPFLLRFVWRVQQSPSVPKLVAPFTNLIEPGDYGPDDVELADNTYVPRGHQSGTRCHVPATAQRSLLPEPEG